MGNLLGECVEDPTAKTADSLVAARAGKRPWLVTVVEAYGGRLAIEATMEPPGQRVAAGGGTESAVEERRRRLSLDLDRNPLISR